jgi:hypothetical protein
VNSPTSPITREEALAALNNPETGSLRVLKAVGKQRDIYLRELRAGATRLTIQSPFEEVCAQRAAADLMELWQSEGKEVPAYLQDIGKKGGRPMADDPSSITREEALAALNNPETGSLRILKAVGKQRDIYQKQLATGTKRLVVHNPFEEVCAEAAISEYTELLKSEGEDVPSDLTLFRSGW